MKQKNKIILKLSVSATLGFGGIVPFAVCGASTYQWTDENTGITSTYGAGWLNFTNTSGYTSGFPPLFLKFVDTTSYLEFTSIAHNNINAAKYWLANSTDPNVIKKSSEDLYFYNLYLNTLPLFLTSILGLALMIIFLPMFYLNLKRLLEFNRKEKKDKENKVEKLIIEEPIY